MDSQLYSLQYPFDGNELIKNKRAIKKSLIGRQRTLIEKKIAILGGSTTSFIKDMLEIFLLNYGIKGEFYESEYAKYWEDAMFDNPELDSFAPDIIYIHTTTKNLVSFPALGDSEEDIRSSLQGIYDDFEAMWLKLFEKYQGVIIQNNFQKPAYRLLGNKEAGDIHGKINFINSLNQRFYDFANKNNNFYINDIDWLSSCFGIYEWSDPAYWYMYKCDPALPAVPELALNLANIIKSVYGLNKKAIALDLDNTLWGGVVGDDGPEGIEIGQETPRGEMYSSFQSYIKEQKSLGAVLAIASKNEEENALSGLNREDSILKPEDFLVIKANWLPKDENIRAIAEAINIGEDAIVFVDDNPAEREIVRGQIEGIGVPELDLPEAFIPVLDRNGYFEATNITSDDMERNQMYQANIEREKSRGKFENYSEYLVSLDMKADIGEFSPMYMDRIAQLTNKANQYNLTTKRYSQAEIESMAADREYITLYGKLTDRFGDNGVVAISMGKRRNEEEMDIDLWLMSCRVLKRDMEFAMMDEFVSRCQAMGIKRIYGHYYPTAKNKMVKDFYGDMGFTLIEETQEGDSTWLLDISEGYQKKNTVIQVQNK